MPTQRKTRRRPAVRRRNPERYIAKMVGRRESAKRNGQRVVVTELLGLTEYDLDPARGSVASMQGTKISPAHYLRLPVDDLTDARTARYFADDALSTALGKLAVRDSVDFNAWWRRVMPPGVKPHDNPRTMEEAAEWLRRNAPSSSRSLDELFDEMVRLGARRAR